MEEQGRHGRGRPADAARGIPGGPEISADIEYPWRSDGGVRGDVHGALQRLSDRHVRVARVCGAAAESARVQRVWQAIPLRQCGRLGRDGLRRRHGGRGSGDRDGGGRSRSHGGDGLELWRLHDQLGGDAHQPFQGRGGGGRRHESVELYGHGGHPRLPAGLLQRRTVGPVRCVRETLADQFRAEREDADAGAARGSGCAGADQPGLRVLSRP